MCFTKINDEGSEELTLSEFINNHLVSQNDHRRQKQEKKNVLRRMLNGVLATNFIRKITEHPQKKLNNSSSKTGQFTDPALGDASNRGATVTQPHQQSWNKYVDKYELRKRHVPIELYASKSAPMECPSVPFKSTDKKRKNTLYCGLYAIRIEYEHLPTPSFSFPEALYNPRKHTYCNSMLKRSDQVPETAATSNVSSDSLPVKMSDKHMEKPFYIGASSVEEKETICEETEIVKKENEPNDKQLESSS